MELLVILAVTAGLAGAAAFALSEFGSRNRIRAEADKVVDTLWELRSRATALILTLGKEAGDPDNKRVRLLPSTGTAKIL